MAEFLEKELDEPLLSEGSDNSDDDDGGLGGMYADIDQQMLKSVLEEVDEFYIQQRVLLMEAITCGCVEQKNIYDIYDKTTMKKILIVREESGAVNRVCCNPNHSLFAEFYSVDESGAEMGAPVMTMEREGCDCGSPCPKPFIGCWACGEGCSHKAMLYQGDFSEAAKPGNMKGAMRDKAALLGATVQPITGGGFTPVLQIMERDGDDNEEPKLVQFSAMKGPTLFGGCSELCVDSVFGISKATDDMGVDEIKTLNIGDFAEIQKHKPDTFVGALREAMTDSDMYSVSFKEKETSVKQKANVMASMILIDYMFFERDNDMIRSDYDGTTITCCNCFCYGCICPCFIYISHHSG
uniref:Phospholipid scramblase n=1 Tax=Ditylum brightwellii TaxID=49249 RepID=A0A7S1ZGY6_9STRA|mmetsp:Transcript_31291/g.46685  ORF Transcript_31291/g.46685 Transcript_31291/m.46685 type:complete len:353 (+) Transcript_31291:31-1089(+)